jgi:hypothetical protein
MRTFTGIKSGLIAGALALGGCLSIDIDAPPAVDMKCNFVMHDLSVTDDFIDPAIQTALENHPQLPLLYLSGGSQTGAFGAGYLKGWADNNGGDLPEFAIVTGVSTGALLSLAAFTNNSEIAVDAYTIDSEDEVLTLFVKNKGDKLSVGDYISTVKSGAVADLIPIRARLHETLDDHDLIALISDRADQNRKLFSVATNLDDGYARAFDLTEMAQRIANESTSSADKKHYQNCFVEALVASSSVPMAARPVFIDNVMYIDGGARFGAMSHRIGRATQEIFTPEDADKRDTYVIFNGDQRVGDDCGLCGPVDSSDRHKNWNLPALAGRSIEILIDQIYQFSQDKIARDSADAGFNAPVITRIDESLAGFQATIAGETKTCKAWRAVDDNVANPPLEFHPNYMRCLIQYGESRASSQ